MSAVNRETCRDRLASLLDTSLVDTLAIATEVTNHKISDLEGRTPLVAVLSYGTLRQPVTFRGTMPTFRVLVQSWVLAEDAGDYDEADAEDTLDLIEVSIADVIDANMCDPGYWQSIQQAEPSKVEDVSVGGHAYYLESIIFEIKPNK